jgi:L-aminopeptidase/D-esterase-like protein
VSGPRHLPSPAGAGPTNTLADIAGLRVGHATRRGAGWLTGTTVIVTSGDGATAGVNVRGGAPGTRETDLLDPRNTVERVHAVVLGGGSAFGLGAAQGVMTRLAEADRGVRVGSQPGNVVPIVPAAILFDLGRGGSYSNYPDPELGAAAYDAAMAAAPADLWGVVGAGTGAVVGELKGGVGSASALLPDGGTVAALAVVNAVGSAVNKRTGILYGATFGLPGEFDWLCPPDTANLDAAAAFLSPRQPSNRPLNTTIGVVATNLRLTKAQCAKLADIGHDGLARAIRPAHSTFDGDTIFGLSTGEVGDDGLVSPEVLYDVLAAAADCFSRAVVHGVLSATSVTTPAGYWPAYLDVFPSAVGE